MSLGFNHASFTNIINGFVLLKLSSKTVNSIRSTRGHQLQFRVATDSNQSLLCVEEAMAVSLSRLAPSYAVSQCQNGD